MQGTNFPVWQLKMQNTTTANHTDRQASISIVIIGHVANSLIFYRQNVPEKLVLLVNMAPVMVPLSERWQRKLKSASMLNTLATSVEK